MHERPASAKLIHTLTSARCSIQTPIRQRTHSLTHTFTSPSPYSHSTERRVETFSKRTDLIYFSFFFIAVDIVVAGFIALLCVELMWVDATPCTNSIFRCFLFLFIFPSHAVAESFSFSDFSRRKNKFDWHHSKQPHRRQSPFPVQSMWLTTYSDISTFFVCWMTMEKKENRQFHCLWPHYRWIMHDELIADKTGNAYKPNQQWAMSGHFRQSE